MFGWVGADPGLCNECAAPAAGARRRLRAAGCVQVAGRRRRAGFTHMPGVCLALSRGSSAVVCRVPAG